MKQAKGIQNLPATICLKQKTGTKYLTDHSVWRLKISISILFFLINIIGGVAQNNALVLNGAYVRMNGGTKVRPIYLVVNRPDTSAIIRTANGGHIHSENQWDIVLWNSGAGTGNYIYPFGVGGIPANYIPFTFNKTTAGNSNTGVSTWATDQQNMPHPDTSNVPAVNSMNCSSMNSTGDSLTAVIDRFWDIKSASATADITFSYLASENTTANPTGTFKAEHWNGTTWDIPVGPGNTGVTAGIGVVGPVTGQSTFSPWALVNIPPPLMISASTATVCSGGAVTFTASGTTSYTWSANAGSATTATVSVSPTTTDIFTVTGSNSGGCTSTQTVSVNVNATPLNPTFSAGDTTYCQGQVQSPIIVNGTGTFTWYSDAGLTTQIATGNSYTPNVVITTTVYVTGTNSGCQSTSLPIVITINQAPTNPTISSSSYTACQGQTVGPITATGSGTIIWSTSPTMSPVVHTGNTYSPTGLPVSPPPIVYYIQDTTNAGCKSTAAATTVTVTINPNPTISGLPLTDTSKCGQNNGGITGLIASGGTPGYTYQWINGSGATVGDSANLHNVGAGTYSLIVTDINQCKDTSNTGYNVIATNAITANFTPSVISGQAPLNVVFTNTSTGANTYTWTLGDGTGSTQTNPAYTYTTNGSYTVTLISANGNCVATATTVIVVDVATTIIIPNIFSPNGDGVNDDFIIMCTGMKTLSCDIFNRWGQLMYTLTGPDQSWDGRLNNGNMASEGTYFYILNAVGLDGKAYSYQGPLTLVK